MSFSQPTHVTHPIQPVQPVVMPVQQKPKPVQEEKNIDKFRLQRRQGRQKRILLDRLFEEDENSLTALPRDFYYASKNRPDTFITSEISSKLSNGMGNLVEEVFLIYNRKLDGYIFVEIWKIQGYLSL